MNSMKSSAFPCREMDVQTIAYWFVISSSRHRRWLAMAGILVGIALFCLGTVAIAQQDIEVANALFKRGIEAYDAGDMPGAVEAWSKALNLYQAIKGTEREQAGCHKNIGVALWNMAQYEAAIAKYERALGMYQAIKGTERDQADCHTNIGVALDEIGQYEAAIAKYERALGLYQAIKGTEREQAGCHGNIGEAHLGAQRFPEAIAAYQKAQESGGSWWTSRGLAQSHRFQSRPGDETQAIHAFLDAVKWAERERTSVSAFEHRTGIFEEPAVLFPDFVSLLVELADKKVAIEEPQVLRWAQDEKGETALLETAFHFADRGKGRALEDAIREKAAMRATTPDEKLLAEDRELSQRISKLTAQKEQLSISSAAPAGNTRRPATTTDVEVAKVSRRRQELEREIEELQQRRNMIEVELKRTALGGYIAPEFRKPMEMAKELMPDAAVLQYSVGEKEGYLLILTRDGVSVHRLGMNTPALPELLARQEADILDLVKAWKERPDQVGLDGLVRLARERAEDLAKEQKRHLVSAPQEGAILERLGHVVLPEPALSELRERGIKRLLVIPDGALHYLPFAMLRIPGKDAGTHYLVEEFSLRYTPAMTTLDTIRKQKLEREQRRQQERRWFLAFANPDFGGEVSSEEVESDNSKSLAYVRSFRNRYYGSIGLRLDPLPESEVEAMDSASRFGAVERHPQPTVDIPGGQAVVYTDRGACEPQVKRILGARGRENPGWRYILFSTHGLVNTQDGMLSCLAFSSPSRGTDEDGLLQAQEILGFQLDTDVVMLSACETGLGRKRGGEGLVGLSASFFYAGADSVCASLWQVPSDATRQLVVEFFKHLKAGKLEKAEALRQAQLTVMRSGTDSDGKPADYSSPFYWAAFVLMGE